MVLDEDIKVDMTPNCGLQNDAKASSKLFHDKVEGSANLGMIHTDSAENEVCVRGSNKHAEGHSFPYRYR